MSAEAGLCCLVDFRVRGLGRDLRDDVLLLQCVLQHTNIYSTNEYIYMYMEIHVHSTLA